MPDLREPEVVRFERPSHVETAVLQAQIGCVGRHIDHCDNIADLFDSAGLKLHMATHAPATRVEDRAVPRIARRMRHWIGQLRGRSDTAVVDRTVGMIDRYGLRCLLAYWGTGVLGEVMAIKRRRPQVKAIL